MNNEVPDNELIISILLYIIMLTGWVLQTVVWWRILKEGEKAGYNPGFAFWTFFFPIMGIYMFLILGLRGELVLRDGVEHAERGIMDTAKKANSKWGRRIRAIWDVGPLESEGLRRICVSLNIVGPFLIWIFICIKSEAHFRDFAYFLIPTVIAILFFYFVIRTLTWVIAGFSRIPPAAAGE